jgi:hypothetical protein
MLQAYQRILPNGTVLDTVYRPGPNGTIMRSQSAATGPFSPRFLAELSPLGNFVTANSANYTVDIHRRVPVSVRLARIVRTFSPARIDPREFSDWSMRSGGRGGAPSQSVPSTASQTIRFKPALEQIRIALDGRLWVSVSTVAKQNVNADTSGKAPAEVARLRWLSPPVFDVFEPTGTYVGRVHFPQELSSATDHVMLGDQIWVALTADSGEQIVRRYRIAWP